MGCDYRRVFLKKDWEAGNVEVIDPNSVNDVDFDYVCLLFIKDRFEFLLPYFDDTLDHAMHHVDGNNMNNKIKFVEEYEYLLTFEKDMHRKKLSALEELDNAFDDDSECGLANEYHTMPMSVAPLVHKLFPLQCEWIFRKYITHEDTIVKRLERNIDKLVNNIVKICKDILIKYGFDKNEFCHINMRCGAPDAILTRHADKNTFFGYKITC